LRPGRGPNRARLPPRQRKPAVRVRLQLTDFGHQVDRLDQVIEPLPGRGRNGHRDHVAAVFLDHDAMLCELLFDAILVRRREVNLVNRDDNRYFGGKRVVDGLDGLRHHSVVCRDHQDGDVGHLGARARIAVNAAWPGVSMKVTSLPSRSTW